MKDKEEEKRHLSEFKKVFAPLESESTKRFLLDCCVLCSTGCLKPARNTVAKNRQGQVLENGK